MTVVRLLTKALSGQLAGTRGKFGDGLIFLARTR